MEFAEVMAKLSPEEQQAITDRIGKVNDEAKGLRERSKGLEEIANKIKTKFGVDVVDDVFLDSLKKTASDKSTLEARFDEERKERIRLGQQLEGMTNLQREKVRDDLIISQLSKIGVRSDAIDSAKKLIAYEGRFNGDTNAWEFNGKPIDLFAQDWAKANAYMIGNPVKPGAGDSRSPNGGHAGGGTDFITESDYMAMTPEQQRDPVIAKKAMASMAKW